MATMKHVERLHAVVESNLFTINATLDYPRVLDALTRMVDVADTLSDEMNAREEDTSAIWNIGGDGHADVGDMIVAAYWHTYDWSGDHAIEKGLAFAVQGVFSPGMSDGIDRDCFGERETFDALREMTETHYRNADPVKIARRGAFLADITGHDELKGATFDHDAHRAYLDDIILIVTTDGRALELWTLDTPDLDTDDGDIEYRVLDGRVYRRHIDDVFPLDCDVPDTVDDMTPDGLDDMATAGWDSFDRYLQNEREWCVTHAINSHRTALDA